MPKFLPNQVEEINAVIKAIEAELKPDIEIGARDKAILTALFKTNKKDKSPKFFKCKREYSDTIVSYFIKEKGVAKNKFSMNAQTAVFLV